MPFATAYLSRKVHVPLAHIGVIFSASQMAQLLAVLLSPAVFRRCGLVAGIMYTQLATAVALSALARAHELPVIVAMYLSFTAFHFMGSPGIYSLLMNRVEEEGRGIASAACSLVTSAESGDRVGRGGRSIRRLRLFSGVPGDRLHSRAGGGAVLGIVAREKRWLRRRDSPVEDATCQRL